MNEKQKFIDWLAANKLKGITPIDLAELLERVFLYFLETDIWKITDSKIYANLRNRIISEKSFRKKYEKAYRVFVSNSNYFQTFLESGFSQTNQNRIDTLVKNELPEASIGVDLKNEIVLQNAVCPEFSQIEAFFNNPTRASLFSKLYCYSKSQCTNLLLEVRTAIIGVKAPQECLRFYCDKDGRLKFIKTLNNPVLIDNYQETIEFCYDLIDRTNHYFADHRDEVRLNPPAEVSSNKCLGYIYHSKFGFGVIENEEQNVLITVRFVDTNNRKILQKGHPSYVKISKETFEGRDLSIEKKQAEALKRIPWDKYETALLIETFWKVEKKIFPKSEAIRALSRDLRKMATNKGMTIDEQYRNENGISLQLSNIALSFFPNRSPMHRTAIFDEVANMFKNNYVEFSSILLKAHEMVNPMKCPAASRTEGAKRLPSSKSSPEFFSLTFDETDFYTYLEKSYSELHKNDGKAGEAKLYAQKCILLTRKISILISTNLFRLSGERDFEIAFQDLEAQKSKLENKEYASCVDILDKYYIFALNMKKRPSEMFVTKTDKKLDVTDYREVLEDSFPEGFAFKNPLRKRKFVSRYQELNNKTFSDNEEEYLNKIKKVGFISEEKVYLTSIVSADLKSHIQSYLDDSLNRNDAGVYYSVLLERFACELNSIFTVEMLRSYLQCVFADRYAFSEDYLSAFGKEANLRQVIIDLFINAGRPLGLDEIYSSLPNVSESAINEVLGERDFVVNRKGKSYFYKDVVLIDETSMSIIELSLKEAVQQRESVTGRELYDFIKRRLPDLAEMNPDVTDIGFKNLLKLSLDGMFSFKGDIISDKDNSINTSALYTEFCTTHEKFSLADLEAFRDGLKQTIIYWDSVFGASLRVSRDEFIKRDKINFDTEKIDQAISAYVRDGYASFKDVINFTDFPCVSVAWNTFLLESFVYLGSRRYALFHASFNSEIPSGAIVDLSSGIKDFDQLLTKIIKENKLFDRDKAFDYLIDNSFISRRRYKNIDVLIEKAQREDM